MIIFLIIFLFSVLCAEGPVFPVKNIDLFGVPSSLSELKKVPEILSSESQHIEDDYIKINSFKKKKSPRFLSILDAQYNDPFLLKNKVTLSLKSAKIEDAIELIGSSANINFVIDSKVNGNVKNINLKNIPVGHALKAILSNNTPVLALKKESNIYRILTLNKAIDELSDKVESCELTKAMTTLQNLNLDEALKSRVKKMWAGIIQGDNKHSYLVFDEDSRKIFFRGSKKQVSDMFTYLQEIDVRIPQVKIEARVVIAKKDFDDSLGLQLSGIYNRRSSIKRGMGIVGTGPLSDIRNNSKNQTGLMDWALNLFPDTGIVSRKLNLPVIFGGSDLNIKRLNIILNAAENKGELKTILKPSILTNHGAESKISVGESVPLETIVKENVDGSIRDITTATYKEVGTILKVKPWVSPDKKYITLDIFVENSSHTQQNKYPLIASASTQCRVALKNGQTGMIGGLIENTNKKNTTSLPLLKDIPIIGSLLKGSSSEAKDHQLLIFITPTIV